MSEFYDAYKALTEREAFDGCHVSIDRDTQGQEYVQIVPDWIDGTGLRFIVDLARDTELSLALTKDGLRLDLFTGELVRGVEAVKAVLRGETDDEDEGA